MNPADVAFLHRAIHDRSGLVLSEAKAYLLESRLAPVAAEEGLGDVAALLARLRLRNEDRLIRRCVDALATHETFFFRDSTPFDQLRQNLPALIAARGHTRSLRIWSAACSSGQEPYSIAMLLQEFRARLNGWRLEILATDMSDAILAKARSGLYSDFEAGRGLTPAQRALWMAREGEHWRVTPAIREPVTFKAHNLLAGAAGLGVFDVVFCRNVLIYFDRDGKRRALDALADALAPDGMLVLGSAESVLGLSDKLSACSRGHGVFRRTAQGMLRRA